MSNYGSVYATPKTAMIGTSRGLSRRQKQYTEGRPMTKKTFKQRFRDWIFADPEPEYNSIAVDHESTDLDTRTSTRFTVHPAHGGTVIQTRTYDERKDRNVENLYIIHRSEDLGEEIAKIITLEGLRA